MLAAQAGLQPQPRDGLAFLVDVFTADVVGPAHRGRQRKILHGRLRLGCLATRARLAMGRAAGDRHAQRGEGEAGRVHAPAVHHGSLDGSAAAPGC